MDFGVHMARAGRVAEGVEGGDAGALATYPLAGSPANGLWCGGVNRPIPRRAAADVILFPKAQILSGHLAGLCGPRVGGPMGVMAGVQMRGLDPAVRRGALARNRTEPYDA